jgi:Tol biopolymer transport system component
MALRLALLTTVLVAAVAGPAHAAFPGGNGLVAFFQDEVGGLEDHGISTAGLAGGGQTGPLGPSCAEGRPDPCPRRPAWSADGRRVAFDLAGRLGVMAADGSNVQLLAFPGIRAARPAWSPGGDRLVFHGRAGGVLSVYVAATDGSGLRRLARGLQPVWSSRNLIAFVRDGRLARIRPDGTGLKRLTGLPGSAPDWSPHAQQLAFIRDGRVHRLRLGGGVRRLTRRPGSNPVWTPDGRWVVFDRGDAGFRAIYRVRPDGTTLRTVTTGNEGRRIQVLEPDVQPAPR